MNFLVRIVVFLQLTFTWSPKLSVQASDSQMVSVLANRVNTIPTANPPGFSSLYCPATPPSSSVKSVVMSNAPWIRQTALSLPNQVSSSPQIGTLRGSSWDFDNPSFSQCYFIHVMSTVSNQTSPPDLDQINVQFIYAPSNTTQTMANSSANRFGISARDSVCGSLICRNGGICQSNGMFNYQCQCDSSGRWLGPDCSKPNPCIAGPCKNGGQCYYLPDATYYCVCYPNYSGANCQFSSNALTPPTSGTINICLTKRLCLNGGTCLPRDIQDQYTCVCLPNYTGINCQVSKFIFVTTTAAAVTMSTTAAVNVANKCGICRIKSSLDLDRIVRGQSVYTYTWPWLVSLQILSSASHFCGGTLVDPLHVITAAHCFDSLGTSPNMFKVVLGLLNLQQISTPGVQQLMVDRIFRHEYYSSTALINDIAVIKLRSPAQISATVYPICLPHNDGSQDPRVGQNVQIAGWGYTDSATKQLAPQLQQATIQVLGINDDLYGRPGCSSWIRRGYSVTDAQQICAMSRDTRTDSCQGDSGGPLIRDVNSQWYLFGIVSYGDPICGSSIAAGVYTRVSTYMPWIQQKLLI